MPEGSSVTNKYALLPKWQKLLKHYTHTPKIACIHVCTVGPIIVKKILQLEIPVWKSGKDFHICSHFLFCAPLVLDRWKQSSVEVCYSPGCCWCTFPCCSSCCQTCPKETLFPFPIPYTGTSSHITVYEASVWTHTFKPLISDSQE